jgi:glycosyltransferase involved in cell wall biosynthesis
MATRVLLFTQWFDPEPTFKGLVFARELVRQGFEVEVLTGFPNYPGGKVYPGYKIKWLQRETIDGVAITRVPLYPSHDTSALGRVFNYLSFSFSALLYGLFKAKKPDVIYAYHPPLTTGITAVLLRFFRRVPVVYDIQDMWPDTLRATGMIANPHMLNMVGGVCSWVYRHTDQLVVLSPGFKQLLIKRGVPEHKIEIIYNWCDEQSLAVPTGNLPEQFPTPEKFNILFAGNMGKAQALTAVLDAAAILQHREPNICFVFVGGGLEVETLKQTAQQNMLRNVVFLPPVPMAEIGNLLNAADVLLVHLKKDPLFKITIPSKTQAYMAVGKPILMGVDGDAANLVKQAQCGTVAQSEDTTSIAEAALKLYQMPFDKRKILSDNSQQFYKDELSLNTGVKKFACLFNTLSLSSR